MQLNMVNTPFIANPPPSGAGGAPRAAARPEAAGEERAAPSSESVNAPGNLSRAEQEQLRELRQTDQEVRRHENAHRNVGGGIAGPPRYQTVRGPDGGQYAVSGEVQIDTSEVPRDPEATARKMDQVIRAALAPAEPSPQDRQVAAEARQKKIEAQAEAQELEAQARQPQGTAQGPAEEEGQGEGPARAARAAAAYQAASGQVSEFLAPQGVSA